MLRPIGSGATSVKNQREDQLERKVAQRGVRRADPTDEKPVRTGSNRAVLGRESARVTGGGCPVRHAPVGRAMRISNQQQSTGHPLELGPTRRQGMLQPPVVERRKRVVASCVKADLEPVSHQGGQVFTRQSGIRAWGPEPLLETLGHPRSRLDAQPLDRLTHGVKLARHANGAGTGCPFEQLRDRQAPVTRVLKLLPPEGARLVE